MMTPHAPTAGAAPTRDAPATGLNRLEEKTSDGP